MSSLLEKGDRTVEGVLLIGCMPCFIVFVLIIAMFRSCMGYGKIDIDNSTMCRREMYDRAVIKDSTGNGYELLWYTTNPVSERRYEEIKSRIHLDESYKKLKEEAAAHFNNDLINTDIYDFVKYAKTFDIDSTDVRLVNVFIYGIEFEKLSQRPHKNYPDGWEMLDDDDFGVLYLEEFDVYKRNNSALPCYRYWGCYATSLYDERYTHITKSDRLRIN